MPGEEKDDPPAKRKSEGIAVFSRLPLVRAEEELGSLFALVERAGQGELLLSEIAALFWFCQQVGVACHHPVEHKLKVTQIVERIVAQVGR